MRLSKVSSGVVSIMKRILASGSPSDLRAQLGIAQGLLHVARAEGGADVREGVLIHAAQGIDHNVAMERFGAVGMLVVLSAPLARAETFEQLCSTLERAPAGD